MTAPRGDSTGTRTGSIYDLGYRHYEGKRNGRLYAMWSLFVESLRGVWGFGRPMSAKAVPLILAGLYALPAVVQLAFSSVITQQAAKSGKAPELLNYQSYFADFSFLVFFFCVAQAPELVCRDQRYSVLPLYFTRAMGRIEYALSRLAALVLTLFVVLLIPALALFVGDVLMKPDAFKAIGDELPLALPSIPAGALAALVLGSLSLAISSFSPRRAYSAIGMVAYILLMEAIPAAIYSIGSSSGPNATDKLFLLSPLTSLMGATNWFFGVPLSPNDFAGTLTSAGYLGGAFVTFAVATLVLMYRYRRLPA
jgi:ABC-2 type transport system permease protein